MALIEFQPLRQPFQVRNRSRETGNVIETHVVGKTLDFWKTNVPRGMFLRSGPDWHIDALDVATFEAYGKMRGLTPAQVKPVPRDTFLDYASWFMGDIM